MKKLTTFILGIVVGAVAAFGAVIYFQSLFGWFCSFPVSVSEMTNCYRTTFTINRKMQTLLWVEEPINQTETFCKNSDTNIRKYTIEDAPGWKKF